MKKKNKTLIIAEAGVNHNGSLQRAKKLVDIASQSGAHIVKFQTFKAEEIVSINSPLAAYQKKTSRNKKSQYELIKNLELKFSEFIILKKFCDKKKIEFLSTAFDIDSQKFLNSLNLKRIKIPSGEITNLPLLEFISTISKPIILSTGLSTIMDIRKALQVLFRNSYHKKNTIILHCNTEYPTPLKDVNLLAMLKIKKEFDLEFGYSDHTAGIEVPPLAVSMGAMIIEKHFTINKKLVGPDHKSSLNPVELKKMISKIKETELIMGIEKKFITSSEEKNLKVVRKSIYAKKEISKGEFFSLTNLSFKRPAIGMSPMNYKKLLNKKSKKNYKKNQLIVL